MTEQECKDYNVLFDLHQRTILERDALKSKCDEMRELIESVAKLAPDFLDDETGHFSKLFKKALSKQTRQSFKLVG